MKDFLGRFLNPGDFVVYTVKGSTYIYWRIAKIIRVEDTFVIVKSAEMVSNFSAANYDRVNNCWIDKTTKPVLLNRGQPMKIESTVVIIHSVPQDIRELLA